MSSQRPENPNQTAQLAAELRSLRRKLSDDLSAFAGQNSGHAYSIVSWVVGRLDLEDLEQLVDDMDEIYRDEGPSGRGYIY